MVIEKYHNTLHLKKGETKLARNNEGYLIFGRFDEIRLPESYIENEPTEPPSMMSQEGDDELDGIFIAA